MKRKLTFIFFVLANAFVFAQNTDTSSQKLIDKIQNDLWATSLKSPEKFNIVTDRPWYLPGEEIWFKTYITTNGLPVTGSGVLYVNLCDSTGRIIYKKITPIDDNGVSYGSIKLGDELKKGWYSLGVQTEWNRNFNDGFEKLIYINEKGEIPSAISFSNHVYRKENSVEFFPEGGNFVAGLQNHFGVKAIGKNGEPAAIKGFIVDNKDTLASFETSLNGLGEFSLPATMNNKLSANIYWPAGNKTVQTLSQMQPAGITLQASIIGERLFYKIESYPEWFAHTSEVLFAITVHGEIIFSKAFNNTAGLISYSNYLSLAQFPNGIATLGIYTKQGSKIAEREIYHNKPKNILLDKKKISFEPKAKNEIEITLPDTLNGGYSLTVTDADLSEELISREKNMRNGEKEMNLYLLTQPANVTDTNILIKYQYQSGLDISGNVFFLNSSRSLNGKTLNLFPKKSASGNFLLTDSLDPAGNFHLGNVFLENSTEMCWNIDGINNRQLDKIRLTLTKSWFDSMRIRPTILKKEIAIKKDSGIDMIVKKTFQQYFSADSFQNKKFKTLPEVTIFVQERKRIEELDNKYANTSLFGGRLGNVFAFDIENEKGQYPSIISYLQGRIPGLTVFGPIYNPLLIYRAPMNLSTTPSTNVAVFVNENRIYEPDQFASIPLDEIAYVKVFKPPFSYVLVSEVPEGLHDPVKSLVIAIYLKKEAKINSFPILAALKSFSVKGFSLPTNFPLPNYSEEKEMENIPDKRITLYWDPEVNFINGKAKIVFYNNDFSKRYLIKLEGINELGEVVSFQQVIEK